MTTYYAEVKGIRDELSSRIQEVSWLSGKVNINTWRTDSSFPCVLIVTERDSMTLEQSKSNLDKHDLVFGIVFRNTSPNTDILVSGAGAIIDKVTSYTTNYLSGGLGWEVAKIGDVNYKYASPGIANEVVGEAYIPVEITKEW